MGQDFWDREYSSVIAVLLQGEKVYNYLSLFLLLTMSQMVSIKISGPGWMENWVRVQAYINRTNWLDSGCKFCSVNPLT